MNRLNKALSRAQRHCLEAMHGGANKERRNREQRTTNNEQRTKDRPYPGKISTNDEVECDRARWAYLLAIVTGTRSRDTDDVLSGVDAVTSGRSAHRQGRARMKNESRGRWTMEPIHLPEGTGRLKER